MITLEEAKKKCITDFCKEFSGNKGKLTVYDTICGIITTLLIALFLSYVCSFGGWIFWDFEFFLSNIGVRSSDASLGNDPEGISMLFSLVTIKNFITGAVVIPTICVICDVLIKIMKTKVMDCPICENENEEVARSITVVERENDYMAFLNNDRSTWAAGKTKEHAIGKLILDNKEYLKDVTFEKEN